MVTAALQPFYPGEGNRYPLHRRLGGPHGQPGRSGENLTFTGIRSPEHPARSDTLYRLNFPGPHNPDTRNVKVKFNIFETLAEFLPCERESAVRESGRILLGDNTDGRAVMLRLIWCQCVGFWISTGPPYIQGVPGGMDKTSGECSLC